MAQVITFEGEELLATAAQNNQQLDIDQFHFYNVPGQDPNAPISRAEEFPPLAQRVHFQAVQQRGKINNNTVVYSTVLDSTVGPFEFNWVGLYSSVHQKLVAIQHMATVVKTETVPGSAGNTLNRNLAMQYSGIAEITGITVEPETWQLDYTARLNGMDELTRQLAADMNGKDWFIGNGFKVVPHAAANSFVVTAGAAYVSGLRVSLEANQILILSSYPQFVYVDAWFDGTSESTWVGNAEFTVTDAELTDYTDSNGKKHFVCKIAEITAVDAVTDLRPIGAIEDINQRLGNKVMGVIDVSEIINNNPEFILPITPELGPYVTLSGHGAANFAITGFGDECPIGYELRLYIPRTIANSGGIANRLGSYVQFMHTASGDGLDMSLNARQNGASTLYNYQAYPNATDKDGNLAALYEQLSFVHIGAGRWRLVALPSDFNFITDAVKVTRSASGIMRAQFLQSLAGSNASIIQIPVEFQCSNLDNQYEVTASVSTTVDEKGLVIYRTGEDKTPTQTLVSAITVDGSNTGTSLATFNVFSSGRWKPVL